MKKYLASLQKIICIMALVLSIQNDLQAQNQNIWIWGTRAGLNFNFSNPVTSSFTNVNPGFSAPYAYESGSSICDNNGQLLFYTEGTIVYDRLQNVMPNGSNLVTASPSMGGSPTASSSQGVVIVPITGQANRYYIFSMLCSETGEMGKLFYSIVDMTLNGGLGDVITTEKGILIDTGNTEQMAAVYHCGNYWLLTIAKSQGQVRAYPISNAGIGNPVLTTLLPASVNTNGAGIIKFSSNGKKVAMSSGGVVGLNIFDFNGTTGILSNQQIIDQTLLTQANGLSFSPDNSKIYISADHNKIYQYDLNVGSAANILASRIAVYTATNPVFLTQMKLAPNGKIYFSGANGNTISGTSYLSTINQPNAQGLACQVQANSLTLAAGTYHHMGMPSDVPMINLDTIRTTQALQSCNIRHEIAALDTTGNTYQWNDGFVSKRRNVSVSGTYWVKYHSPCGYQIDSFHVSIIPPVITQIRKVLCGNESITFSGRVLNTTGFYRDTVKTANGCDSITNLDLIVIPRQEVTITYQLPEAVCLDDSLLFQGSGAQLFSWYVDQELTSLKNPSYLHLKRLENGIMLVGTSTIGGSDVTCSDTAYVNVNAISCCELFLPNAFTPNGDGKNDVLSIKTEHRFKGFMFEVYNRWGQIVFSTNQSETGWDGYFSGKPVDLGVYHYYIKYICDDGTNRIRKGDITVLR